ncbi:MAG: hypothetical protein ABI347_02115 [Nitrososphaera sp.]
MREEYVGKMHFAMSSYDQMDIFHFGLDDYDDKPTILLLTVRHPYDMDEFVPKALRLTRSRAGA